MNVKKWIKILLGIILIVRIFPLFAYIYTWFEIDDYYVEVFEFVNSIFFTLLAVLIFLFCYKDKMGKLMYLIGFYVFMELSYLAHHFAVLFTTDYIHTQLGFTIPVITLIIVFNLKRFKLKIWKKDSILG